MRTKYLILLLITALFVVACGSRKNMPGRRRAPRNCKGCTKWSYVLPADTIVPEQASYASVQQSLNQTKLSFLPPDL